MPFFHLPNDIQQRLVVCGKQYQQVIQKIRSFFDERIVFTGHSRNDGFNTFFANLLGDAMNAGRQKLLSVTATGDGFLSPSMDQGFQFRDKGEGAM